MGCIHIQPILLFWGGLAHSAITTKKQQNSNVLLSALTLSGRLDWLLRRLKSAPLNAFPAPLAAGALKTNLRKQIASQLALVLSGRLDSKGGAKPRPRGDNHQAQTQSSNKHNPVPATTN